MCGTSKAGVISVRDIGCWTTTFPLSAASARVPCTAGTKNPGCAAAASRNSSRVKPEASHFAIGGTSRSPSPSAKTSTNGASAAGFIRAMSPPTSRIGCRSSRFSRRAGMPAAARVFRMLTMSISQERDQARRPKSESGAPVSKVAAGPPSSWKKRSQTRSGTRLKSRYTHWKPRFDIPTS